MVCGTGPAPNQADTVAFWRGLWSEPVNHSEDLWTKVVASHCASITPMEPIITTPDDVAEAVRRAPNWKSPGFDGLYHYWLKGFMVCHAVLARNFQEAFNQKSLPSLFTTGITHLVPKEQNINCRFCGNSTSFKMQVITSKFPYLNSLAMCFVIGYLHLLSTTVNISCHFLLVSIVSGGFQCDVDANSLRAVEGQWLDPILLFLNLGTHGFYPFPIIITRIIKYIPKSNQPNCYPGILHIYLNDVLHFLINVIWLRLVISFISAVHKRDPERMRMLYGLSLVKLAAQVIYLVFKPDTLITSEEFLLCVIDICIAALFVRIMSICITRLRAEKLQPINDQPPSYVECITTSPTPNQSQNLKKESENVLPIEDNNNQSPTVLPI
ncbi:unnamed protein product [Parnassius apollo]|uniref:(apollo) hypothetical protein n=1 Tax=Parnassius apollo TaxID=110799 RepID=A0A8S3Y6R0_PARAO|nr:unnamed protein product [Parnassius apollo]